MIKEYYIRGTIQISLESITDVMHLEDVLSFFEYRLTRITEKDFKRMKEMGIGNITAYAYSSSFEYLQNKAEQCLKSLNKDNFVILSHSLEHKEVEE